MFTIVLPIHILLYSQMIAILKYCHVLSMFGNGIVNDWQNALFHRAIGSIALRIGYK